MPEPAGHLEAKIDALTEKVDMSINEQRQSRTDQGKVNAELFRRVGSNEGDIKALQQTRPTIPQLLAAMVAAIGAAVGIISLFINS